MEKDEAEKDPPPLPKTLKYLTTLAILFGNITFGCAFNFFGPALEDLKSNFGTSIEGISIVFTIINISYCVGGLSSGVIYNLMNRQLAVSICLGGIALALFATPHVPSKTVFFVLGAALGFFAGAYDTAQLVWMMELWQGEAGPYIQAQSFCYALGTIIPPALIAPFLQPESADSECGDEASSNPNITTTTSATEVLYESNIFIPFTIGGAFITLACAYQLFLFTFFRYTSRPALDLHYTKEDHEKQYSVEKGDQFDGQIELSEGDSENPGSIRQRIALHFKQIHWYKVKLIALTALFLASYVGMEWCTFEFVPVFGKYSDLKMCESDSARVLIGVTAAFAAGRLVGIFVILKVNPQYLVVVNLFLSLCGSLIILIWGSGNLTMLWVGCATLGTGLSLIYPSFCAYMEPQLLFTDAIGAFIIVSSAGVGALYPVIVGRYIEENPVVLTYTNMFSIAVCTTALIVAFKITAGNHRRV